MTRRFSLKQRRALYLAADGRCEICNEPLEEGWHADHVTPYSKGGPTTIDNGQALCPQCNQEKGSNEMIETPNDSSPREWQRDFWNDYLAKDKQRYLLGACPGSGKSWAGAGIAQSLISRNVVQRVVVLSPSTDKRIDWANDLADFGVKTTPNWNGKVRRLKGFVGFSLTYQALNNLAANLRRLTQVPTLLILDEVHHLADQQTWGQQAQWAFDRPSVRVLSLTGTPFRSDQYPIPFVEYEGGEVKVDFEYTYRDGLVDRVVRHCNFKLYDGEMRWDSSVTGEIEEHSFTDEIPDPLFSERLQTAIDPRMDYVAGPLEEAHRRLMEIRKTHPDAAGLYVAESTDHIPVVEELMRKRLGVEPEIIISDDQDAHDRLERFKEADSEWVIAIRMISEGVNVKRLRVGVYASLITTPMFIHQVVGRVIRWVDGIDPQQAWFWFPHDPRIVPTVENIREMMRHAIEEREEREREEGDTDREATVSSFTPLAAESTEARFSSTMMDHLAGMSPAEIAKQDPELVAAYIEHLRGDSPGDAPLPESTDAPEDPPQAGYRDLFGSPARKKKTKPDWQREEELRPDIQRVVRKIAKAKHSDLFSMSASQRGQIIAREHGKLNRAVGVESQDDMTVSQLERKLNLAREALRSVTAAGVFQ